jgi:hypothetical protein
MESRIADACITVLKREDVKSELKRLFTPIVDLILVDIYPYIYLSLIFVLISFVLHIGIFVMLIRGKPLFTSKCA